MLLNSHCIIRPVVDFGEQRNYNWRIIARRLRSGGGVTENKKMNVLRFPDCDCSEDYLQEQGMGKNYKDYNDLCTGKKH